MGQVDARLLCPPWVQQQQPKVSEAWRHNHLWGMVNKVRNLLEHIDGEKIHAGKQREILGGGTTWHVIQYFERQFPRFLADVLLSLVEGGDKYKKELSDIAG